MSLRLSVGVTRKIGLPSFSGVGASCHIELELDLDLDLGPEVLESDLDGFHEKVRVAYLAAHQAVKDELARLQAPPTPPTVRHWIEAGRPSPHGQSDPRPTDPQPTGTVIATPGRPATANQARAIRKLAAGRGADLDGLPCDLDVAPPENLTLDEASRLIDRPKALAPA